MTALRFYEEVTPGMLAAGREAFLRKRKQLDDLYDYFADDLDEFLLAIYRKMAGQAPLSSATRVVAAVEQCRAEGD